MVFRDLSFSTDFAHIINGIKVYSRETQDILNPTNEEILASVPIATQDQLNDAVGAASLAFPTWGALAVEERQNLVTQLGDLIKDNCDAFVELVIKEVGKSRALAAVEVGSCVEWFHGVATQSLPPETILDTPQRTVTVKYVPYGVCATITPWNFPLSLLIWKLAPALVTGNCVVVKPSPYAPLSAIKFVELAQRILPPGVLSVLSGDENLGPWIVEHPNIARISLTGSIPVGQSVMRSAAASLKSLTLELGGNDAAVILKDVDPKQIAPMLFWGTFFNSGQICAALKRIYIHEDIYDAVRDELVAYTKTIRIGDCLDPEVGMGPVQNKEQYRRLRSLIEECHAQGYKFACGGNFFPPERKGYFLPVSIVDNPPEDSRIVQEEQFGPVVPLLKWRNEEDVIRQMNYGDYGLAASVWSKDVKHAEEIAERLEAGTVWINESQQFHWNQPFGGFKHSGIGVEHSKHGLVAWTNIKSITANRMGA
ncbi:aldehyde dehydrogenase family protein [Desarmillaria tabescens]|uniref:Aldehyde dehydrogenase family protein n=1 Tax=Armillaria tabescens TaxID=1929756 RepID=A0AA39N5K5_ARMTA|nr:aldehyde dehydrogenase family protein [Desarmillaria tabescens]KAK0458971.1 aldehyde dehydrogenase family protein [Desarmillaria tabescens]